MSNSCSLLVVSHLDEEIRDLYESWPEQIAFCRRKISQLRIKKDLWNWPDWDWPELFNDTGLLVHGLLRSVSNEKRLEGLIALERGDVKLKITHLSTAPFNHSPPTYGPIEPNLAWSGAGSILLGYAACYAQEKNYKGIELNATADAVDFYRHIGFRIGLKTGRLTECTLNEENLANFIEKYYVNRCAAPKQRGARSKEHG